jgi:hypothetical protein
MNTTSLSGDESAYNVRRFLIRNVRFTQNQAQFDVLDLQSVAAIKKTHGTRSVPDFLRFLGLFHNQVPAFLSKNGPKWANLISNPQFSSALRAGGTGFSYVFRRNPVPYFLMPVLLNARN